MNAQVKGLLIAASLDRREIKIEEHVYANDLSCYQTLINLGSNAVVVSHSTQINLYPHPNHKHLYPAADTQLIKIECELYAGRRIDVTKAFNTVDQDLLREAIELYMARALEQRTRKRQKPINFAQLLHTHAQVVIEAVPSHIDRHHPTLAGHIESDTFAHELGIFALKTSALAFCGIALLLGVL